MKIYYFDKWEFSLCVSAIKKIMKNLSTIWSIVCQFGQVVQILVQILNNGVSKCFDRIKSIEWINILCDFLVSPFWLAEICKCFAEGTNKNVVYLQWNAKSPNPSNQYNLFWWGAVTE